MQVQGQIWPHLLEGVEVFQRGGGSGCITTTEHSPPENV